VVLEILAPSEQRLAVECRDEEAAPLRVGEALKDLLGECRAQLKKRSSKLASYSVSSASSRKA